MGAGRPSVPPLRFKRIALIIRTVPLIRHASHDTFPQGKALRAADSRPYGKSESVPSFRSGRIVAGPSRSFCHSGAHPHPPRFARHLPPWRGKACGRVRTPAPTANLEASLLFVGAGHWPARRCTRRVQEAAPYSSAPAATCSVNLGAEVERRSREFLLTQGPVAREESRRSLRFCAPEILQSPAGTRPP